MTKHKHAIVVPMKQVVLAIVGILSLGALVVFGTLYLSDRFLPAPTKNKPLACATTGVTHTASIVNGTVSPIHINAKHCDVLTIVNNDSVVRRMAFGQHDEHIVYNGVSERILKQNESLTVTLDQTGEYLFHDHYQESTQGTILVQ